MENMTEPNMGLEPILPRQSEKKDEPEVIVEEVAAPDAGKPAKEIPLEDGIAELKAQLEAEKVARAKEAQARADAERQMREATQREVAAKNEVAVSHLDMVKDAIERLKQSNDHLTTRYEEALTVGDYSAAAKINRGMTDNFVKLGKLEDGKISLETRAKEPARAPAVDPVEALASSLSPKSAAWVRAHPEFATDGEKFEAMIAADKLARRTTKPDTPEYFTRVERLLEIDKGTDDAGSDDPTFEAAKVVHRREAPPPSAAPVSRAASATGGGKPNVVRLTAAERDMAQMMGQSVEEYARNKMALQREGKLN